MENVNEVLADANAKIAKSFETLKSQFAGLRTGKASPALVDGVKVDYYGAPTPIKNLATISTPEPRQIKIAPFDPSVLGEMNKAILAANLGVTPQTDGRVLRITIPEICEESLGELIYFFEFSCALGGYLLDINPFDQPGVEAYKKNMFRLLGKE